MQKTTDNIYVLLLLCIGGVLTLVVSFVLIYIRHQNRLLTQQKQIQLAAAAHQRELLQTVIESQETERKRIGQDLHDDVGTALSNLRFTVEMFNPEEPAAFQHNCKTIIDQVIQNVRHISHNLSPPGLELYGFTGAVEELFESAMLSRKLDVNIHNQAGELLDQLGKTASISLYRVLEELLNNTVKHSGATTIQLDFDQHQEGIVISYRDNGRGIAPVAMQSRKGMGSFNIESRLAIIGAAFTIDAPEGQGYHIQIRLKNQGDNE